MFQVFEVTTIAKGRRGHFWVGRAALSVGQWLNDSVSTPSFGDYFMGKNSQDFPLREICPG